MFKRLLKIKYLFVFNLTLVVLIGIVFGRAWVRHRQIEREIAALETHAQDLSTRNVALTELSGLLRTESFLEREARLKLGKMKPGEQVVVVKQTGEQNLGEEAETTSNPLETLHEDRANPAAYPNPRKWRMYVFEREAFGALKDYVRL